MKKIVLIGAGGHCVSCIDVIELEKKFIIYGLIDNNKKFLLKYKVIGKDKNQVLLPKESIAALDVKPGDSLRYVELSPGAK